MTNGDHGGCVGLRLGMSACFCFAGLLAVAAPGQFCSVVKTDVKPVIDGVRDNCYRDAFPISGFSHPRLLEMARNQTTAKFLHDGEYLYGHVVCADPNVRNMSVTSSLRDDVNLWRGDAVEMFFVAEDGLKHFIVSPDGGLYDAASVPDEANVWRSDAKWNSGMVLKTVRDDASWSFEFALPLKDIPGGRMRFNIARDTPDGKKASSWTRLEDFGWIPNADKVSIFGELAFLGQTKVGGFDWLLLPKLRKDGCDDYCLVKLTPEARLGDFSCTVQDAPQRAWGDHDERFGFTFRIDMAKKGAKDVVFEVNRDGALLFRQVAGIPAGYIIVQPSNLKRKVLYLNSNQGMAAKLAWDCKHNYPGARMSNGGQIEKPFKLLFEVPEGVAVVGQKVEEATPAERDGRTVRRFVQSERYAYVYPDYFSTRFTTTLPAGSKGTIRYALRYEDGEQGFAEVPFEVIDLGVAPQLKELSVGHYNLYVRSLEDAKVWAKTGVNMFAVRGYDEKALQLAKDLKAAGFRVRRGDYFWPGSSGSGDHGFSRMGVTDPAARAKDINGKDIALGTGYQLSPAYRGPVLTDLCRKEAEFCRAAGIDFFAFDLEDYIQKKGQLGDFSEPTVAFFKKTWATRYPDRPVPEPKDFEREPEKHPVEHAAWVDAKCELWGEFFETMKRLLEEGIGRKVVFSDWSFNVFSTVEERNHSLRNARFFRAFDVREASLYSSLDRDLRQIERYLGLLETTFRGLKQKLVWCPSPYRYSLGKDSSDWYWSTVPELRDEITYSLFEGATFGIQGIYTFKVPMIDLEFQRQFINGLNAIAPVEDIVKYGTTRDLETDDVPNAAVYDKFNGKFEMWYNQRRVFARANAYGDRTLVSVSEYRDRKPMTVRVTFPHAGTVRVTDLATKEVVTTLAAGENILSVDLPADRRCRLLLVEPVGI